MEKKYYTIRNRYLADSLAFLDFKYYKFNDNDGTVFSFEDTKIFREYLTTMLDLRKQIRK